MRMRTLLKRPAYVVMLFISSTVDLIRYMVNASVIFLHDSDTKLAALIRKDNHRIEKGLALPEPKLWFGEAVLARLSTNLTKYLQLKNAKSQLLDESNTVLNEYKSFFSSRQTPPEAISRHLIKIAQILGKRSSIEAGTVEIKKNDIFHHIDIDYEQFVKSRYSIRQFTGKSIEKDKIKKVIDLAIQTPSVCNRCAWKVYNISSPDLLKKVLACQNGNAGFGQSCGNVLIVAMDLRCFEGGGERNQAYVDGGLFAMSLVYALHSEGVASCFLNWSADYFQDSALRKILNIGSHEVIVTFIGIGEYPEILRVAISPRPSVNDVLVENILY